MSGRYFRTSLQLSKIERVRSLMLTSQTFLVNSNFLSLMILFFKCLIILVLETRHRKLEINSAGYLFNSVGDVVCSSLYVLLLSQKLFLCVSLSLVFFSFVFLFFLLSMYYIKSSIEVAHSFNSTLKQSGEGI